MTASKDQADAMIGIPVLGTVPVAGRKVLLRVDYNVPMENGRITDDTRIKQSLPTLNYLLDRGCRVIIVSHLGRPGGRVVEDLRLDAVARRLAELINKPVRKTDTVVGPEVRDELSRLPAPGVLMLENVRFDPRETSPDAGEAGALAAELAALADVYVNDAFGTAHRAHASTALAASRLPSMAGLLMARELEVLGSLVKGPAAPFWAIIGGAKISDKLGVLEALLDRCHGIALGGGMANTFLAARGAGLGDSLVEEGMIEQARAIMDMADAKGRTFLLPVDLVAADSFDAGARHRVCPADEVPHGWQALDIGPETLDLFRSHLGDARTVFWNGPLGVAEWDAFAGGTRETARLLASLDAVVVIGGGDSVAAVHRAGVADAITHISTGGGASLEFIEGRPLPGVEALKAAP